MPSFFMSVNNTAWRDVYRPTMFRELKVPGNKGVEVIMVDAAGGDPPGPGPEYADLAMSTPVVTGEAVVGETLTCSEPTVTGGSGSYEFTYTWKLKEDGETTFANGSEVVVPPGIVGKEGYCEVAALDATADQSISKGSNVVGPVVAAREPITVTMAAKWADLNNYVVGQTVYADTAGYEGGLEETTTYRWRTQTRPAVNGSITNGKWTNYTDHAEEVSVVLEEAGQIRFQCQARDTGIDPVEQVNSFASWEDVEALPTTIGTITIEVLDQAYDWENPATLTVLMNDDISIVTTISGDANPTYQYSVRDTNMEYEITPPESIPGTGNGPDIIYKPTTAGLHTVSINISDKTATDDGEHFPGVPLWVVDAKTWAELQAEK